MSSYRIQVAGAGGLEPVAELVPYLRELGVSTLYLSPVFQARSGSTHGYDVVDPGRIDPALGGEPALERLATACGDAGLGMLLDIVPNHMASSRENPWWWSVLEGGPSSPYARFFDIDWDEPEGPAHGRVILPILGRRYHAALEAGELRVVRRRGGYALAYFDHRLPLDVSSHPVLSGRAGASDADVQAAVDRLERTEDDTQARAELDGLLTQQPYWLVHWRTASEEVNYRRFFDISHLVALRMEREEVFQAWHGFLADLVRRFPVTGVRVDHVDGLADPEAYLARLRALLDDASGDPGGPLLLVEKILAPDERLPDSWDSDGTTGYDFLAAADRALVCPEGVAALRELYLTVTASSSGFEEASRRTRRKALRSHFRRDLDRLVKLAVPLVRSDPRGRDLAHSEVATALTEITVQLDVYRTYLTGASGASPAARAPLDEAARRARRHRRDVPVAAVDVLSDVLTREPREPEVLALVTGWQQLTGAVMAKGVEDTAFYAHHALASLNEVGSDPGADPGGVEAFHADMAERADSWPRTMNATSTHDTKRSEDVRARIHVLSEMASEWETRLERWHAWNDGLRTRVGSVKVPTPSEEWLLYQTLVGVWPLDPDRASDPGHASDLEDRLADYLRKAAREAKVHTSWHRPRPAHEDALIDFMRGILDPERDSPFLADFRELQERVAFFGAVNSLSLLTLKLSAPGRPDIYQGNELWRFSLVDPDNRRPVDWSRRRGLLRELRRDFGDEHADTETLDERSGALLEGWRDGRVKLLLTWKGLSLRRRHETLLAAGGYEAAPAEGEHGRHVMAFTRRAGSEWLLTLTPRLTSGLTPAGTFPLGDSVWGDTSVRLPDGAPEEWTDALVGGGDGGAAIRAEGGRIRVADALRRLPVALLVGRSDGRACR